MAKRPGGQMGGMQSMMAQAQRMQSEMLKSQAELDQKEYSATAGGGAVKCTVTGKRVVKSIEIAPELVDPDDIEMLCDIVTAAVNEALSVAETDSADQMAKLSGGLGALKGMF